MKHTSPYSSPTESAQTSFPFLFTWIIPLNFISKSVFWQKKHQKHTQEMGLNHWQDVRVICGHIYLISWINLDCISLQWVILPRLSQLPDKKQKPTCRHPKGGLAFCQLNSTISNLHDPMINIFRPSSLWIWIKSWNKSQLEFSKCTEITFYAENSWNATEWNLRKH